MSHGVCFQPCGWNRASQEDAMGATSDSPSCPSVCRGALMTLTKSDGPGAALHVVGSQEATMRQRWT